MKYIKQCRQFLVWAIVFCSYGAFAGELEDGIQAFEEDDYQGAEEILQPLAEHHGYIRAMNVMGQMEELGLGRDVNGEAAARWYEKAALLRDEDAMYNLGVLYGEGKAVEKDLVKSMAWLGAAYDHRQKDALVAAKLVSSKLSEDQLAEAGQLRQEIQARIYEEEPAHDTLALSAPPVDASRLLSSEQIVEAYSGKISHFMFRESEAKERYKKHRSRKKALAGKKSKVEGEYRDGFYKGKWWVEDNMLCLNYARLDDFDDCLWIENVDDNNYRTYSRKTGQISNDMLK